jgi:maltooligosyltrehalose trehalohydrolase
MSQPARFWAPRANRLEVIVGTTRAPARQEPGGWWVGPILAPGQDYAISVDGGPPRPDPRSRWQPDGVHGASRWVEPSAVVSRHRAVPLRDAVIYELHIGTFSGEGTFAAAIPHLDHLVDLGITHVEIMPVAQFSGTHGWGYDGVDLFAAHAPYGGPDGLRALIAACHDRDLAVLIDVVHNHLGPEGAYLPEVGPYKTDQHKTPWGEAINLDADGSVEVRRFLIDSALMWLRDYGADGLRLDALHALVDDSERHFVAELSAAVRDLSRELDRPLVLIGEWDEHDPKAVIERDAGGWGLDAHWDDDFHHAVHALVTGERSGYYVDFADAGALPKILQQGYALDGGMSPFRGKPHGKPYGDLARDRLVAYIQSHDQVGNRAAGERLHHLCGIERAKVAAALLFVSPFVPMVFQGEEWAASTPFCYFAELESEELRRLVREGRKAEHANDASWDAAPDPTDPATRLGSVLVWDERALPPHAEMLAWYRDLISLRRANANLRDGAPGSTQVTTDRDGKVIRVHRGPHTLIANLSESAIDITGERVVLTSSLVPGTLPANTCAIVVSS